jgi:hypothetical protein
VKKKKKKKKKNTTFQPHKFFFFFFFFTNSYFIIDIYALSNSVLAFPGLLYLIKEEKKEKKGICFVFLRLPKSVLIMTKKKRKKKSISLE